MVEQRVDDSFAAVDQVDNALRQSGLLEQFEDVAHRERHALGGLEDEGVAARDRVRQKPERDHPGKVEGHDRGDDAERLANHHFVDAARDVFEVVALHHHGNAAGDFDVLDGAAHLGFGFAEGLAVFLGDDAADLVEVIFEQQLQLEQRLDAVFGRRAPPGGIGSGRGVDRLRDLSGIGERNFRDGFAGGGIDDVRPFSAVDSTHSPLM